ncbi:MAG: aminomethyl-transferring glycine dehydrogenase subunit GcvPA [Chloroflexi bacterium]|nr:aminomethyl-transferring glycine dehydrogenase subunit GcvPA [Chloroflexota bacterium]
MPSPYLPNTDADRAAMLRDIGVSDVEELFQDIPREFRSASFDLPRPSSEPELKAEMRALSGLNANLDDYACFLGAGFYRHFIPSVVGHMIGRSEFYTAYTPYQAEVSQGTLQTTYEYQSLVCQLTGMEVSNAGMYDGSTAAAEAALMANRLTERDRISVLSTVNPRYREVIETYARGHDLVLEDVPPGLEHLSPDSACLIVQQPSFLGCLEDLGECARKSHGLGALLIVITYPVSLGMLRPPSDYGADIVVGEGQSLGSPISFGGPVLGLFACRREYLRQIPGRIVGKTTDVEGSPGYVLTLATREQHIRRERATSNICTNEALIALAAAVYLAALGKAGLRRVAELCYHKAHYAASKISGLKGYSLVYQQPFFNEFAVRCPAPPARINRALFENGVIGGLDLSGTVENGMLLCVTELNTRQQIDRLIEVLARFQMESENEPSL